VISHDLSMLKYLADRIGVMYLGRLVELGTSDEVYGAPHHPDLGQDLLSALGHRLLRRHPGLDGLQQARAALLIRLAARRIPVKPGKYRGDCPGPPTVDHYCLP
jgi:ABC-type antimicrobial peptide transport system ATPase subunit